MPLAPSPSPRLSSKLMVVYQIDSKASKLIVTARSSVHNTDTSWSGITGIISATTGDGASDMQASIEVDMTTANAGDWLKNRKLRKDMQFEKYPRATFVLDSVENITQSSEDMSATIRGTLCWRDECVEIAAKGQGTLNPRELVAHGRFDIDVTTLGITPPKILMIKVQDVVSCRIDLRATAQ